MLGAVVVIKPTYDCISIHSLCSNQGNVSYEIFWSQLLYISIGLISAFVVYHLPLKIYCKISNILLLWLIVLILLFLTFLFATPINGSKRWLSIGGFSLQAAELAKMVMVMVASEYVVRRSADMRGSIFTGWRLFVWYLPILLLLISQPDYGSTAVIMATLLVIAWIGGSPLKDYVVIFVITLIIGILGIFLADYRRERLLSFWDPFDDIRGSDFQLSRSLIAFGRGQLTGVGYGDSVQKLSHLPEAHTDFILAITGEELGFWCGIRADFRGTHSALHRYYQLCYTQTPSAASQLYGYGVCFADFWAGIHQCGHEHGNVANQRLNFAIL